MADGHPGRMSASCSNHRVPHRRLPVLLTAASSHTNEETIREIGPVSSTKLLHARRFDRSERITGDSPLEIGEIPLLIRNESSVPRSPDDSIVPNHFYFEKSTGVNVPEFYKRVFCVSRPCPLTRNSSLPWDKYSSFSTFNSR